MSKHDQNRAEKRERLVRAGLDAFTETGFDNTTVSDVVRRAGMTPSTFYNYYRDKEALLSEILDRVAADLLAGLKTIRRDATDVESFVALACSTLMDSLAGDKAISQLMKRNLTLVRSLLDHDSLDPVFQSLVQDVDRAVEAGHLNPIDAQYTAALMRATALEIGISMLQRADADPVAAAEFSTAVVAGALQRLSDNAKPRV